MNVRQMVARLSSQGYKVNYRVRPDGGIRIIQINGTSYPSGGGKGNQAARNILGESLTTAQKKQRSAALEETYTSHKVTALKPRLTKKEKYQLRKMNKISSKVGGWRVGAKEARAAKGREGSFKSVKAGWRSSIRHHTGRAYADNLEAFLNVLETSGTFIATQNYLQRAIDGNYPIIDAQLVAARQIWYNWQNEGTASTESAEDDRAVAELKKSWSIYKEVLKQGEGWKGYASKHKE